MSGLLPGTIPVPVQAWGQPAKTMILDLSCSVASARYMRNVLKSRATAQNPLGSMLDQAFSLSVAASGSPVSSYTVSAPSGNSATVVAADSPVQLILSTSNGVLNMGENVMFVLTSPILSLQFSNVLNLQNINISCLIV